MLPHVFVKAAEPKWQGREWKVRCPRRSADNVWELHQLASIPACGNLLDLSQIGRAQKSSLSDICRLRGPPVWNRGVKPVVTPSTGVLASIAVETPNKLLGDSGGRKTPREPDGSAKLG